ncbi:LOG family protein [Megalodesulfovibrio gigas]|nr:TIGR00730 family Rossman fold protein [Megalodesulfovibrio gigas]
MASVCVFCGANPGNSPAYLDSSKHLGRLLARRGITLVYGGASVGCMGAVADAALDAGGRVVGIIPRSLWEKEIGHPGLTELLVVDSMHERKAAMAAHSDAFIALPGGVGTLEEFFEVMTWSQLGFHHKPCGLLNVGGYYDGLAAFLDHAVTQGFLKEPHRRIALTDADPEALLEAFARWIPPRTGKWIEKPEQL